MRLDEELAIVLATARAIDEELNNSDLSVDKAFRVPDLPPVSPKHHVQEYLDAQRELSSSVHEVEKENTELDQPSEPKLKVKLEPFMQGQVTRPEISPLTAVKLNPNTPFTPALLLTHTMVSPYIEFMARREHIYNKIEKFDDLPESFHTWKGSFNNMISNFL